jgi:hypothetical protein
MCHVQMTPSQHPVVVVQQSSPQVANVVVKLYESYYMKPFNELSLQIGISEGGPQNSGEQHGNCADV